MTAAQRAGNGTAAGGTADAAGGERTTIVWFRNDLRLADNAAVRAAAANGARVLPVFVLDRSAGGPWALGGASRWWLHGSLASLDKSLDARGAPLVLRAGDPADIIPALARDVGAGEIHCGLAHEPAVRDADRRVAAALPDRCRLVHHRTATLRGFDEVATKTGGAYGIYTPYAKAARALGTPDRPREAPRSIRGVGGIGGDRLDDWALRHAAPDWAAGLRETWHPGEDGARDRLGRFVRDHLDAYAGQRDRPGDPDGTSMLSPHLHWGEMSPNEAWHAAAGARPASRTKFENELLWHDFAAYTLWHAPTMPDRPMRPQMERLAWRRDRRFVEAWQRGRTGIPIVDAGMRQLWRIGWMHNRVRMITASFLIKHGLIDWTVGERWFWDTLVDADLATNAMSWQWVAGSGTDSAPFFRVFNPELQSRRFDGGGSYIRFWVPEIARLPDTHLHAPWQAPSSVLEDAGVALGRDYPRPLVDLDAGRARALDAFARLRAPDPA